MDFQDILRSIVLGEIVITFIFAGLILYNYAARQIVDNQLKTNLTWHVITMLVVFLLVCAYMFADIIYRWGTPLTWRPFVLIPIFTLGIAGEWFMYKFQVKRRIRPSEADTEIKTTENSR